MMLSYDFMIHAFAASAIVAAVAGAVGFFLVLRGQTFAGHALSHVGFAGATGAALIGLSPFTGLAASTVLAGVCIGMLGEKLSGRDVAIGMVLSLSLGFGLLFLHFYTSAATQATALLFGNVLAVSVETILTLLVLGAAGLAGLAIIARPLIFASLQPELAEAKGVSLRLIGVLFLAIVAIAVAESAQVVGVLLVFTLMIGPAAAAQRLTTKIALGVLLAIGLALIDAWGGLVLAFYTDWPTSFWITALSGLIYFVTLIVPDVARISGKPIGRSRN
jgi:zinc/manganese transport system permease protein